MLNVHFICFAGTVLLHTENDYFHHLLLYNALPMHVLNLLLVDFVYMFRNFVNVYQKKMKRCTCNLFTRQALCVTSKKV